MHYPQHTLPSVYTTLSIHYPQDTLPSGYTTLSILYPQYALPSVYITLSMHYPSTLPSVCTTLSIHYPQYTLPSVYTTLSIHYPQYTLPSGYTTLSILYPVPYRSRQTSSLSVASRSVVNRKKQHLVKVGTFNVRMLRTDFRAFELQKLAADLKIDVLVIQEHRRSWSDVDFQRNLQEINSNLPKGWQILLGAPSAPGVGGIRFLLSSRCSPWLLDYKFVTDRVAVASFDMGNRRLHIICAYCLSHVVRYN